MLQIQHPLIGKRVLREIQGLLDSAKTLGMRREATKRIQVLMGYVKKPSPGEPTCATCSIQDVVDTTRKGRTKATMHICTTGNFKVRLCATCLFHCKDKEK